MIFLILTGLLGYRDKRLDHPRGQERLRLCCNISLDAFEPPLICHVTSCYAVSCRVVSCDAT